MTNTDHRRWMRIAAAGALVFIFLFIQSGWFMVILGSPEPVEAAFRDWVAFHRTAERVVSGRAAEIYPVDFAGDGRPEFSDGFHFLYPPFAIWVTVPLAALSRWAAYLACVSTVAVGILLATNFLLGALRVTPVQRLFGTLGMMASAPFNAAALMGHLGTLLVIPPSAALLFWVRRRPGLAGLALSPLLAKPNWGLPFLFFLSCGRLWRMVGGFILGGVVLVLLSLPLGPGLWGDWFHTMVGYQALITDATPPWKQVTLFASLQSLAGRSGSDSWVVFLWVSLSLPLMGATGATWLRWGAREEAFPRLLGLALLAILVTNPYAYFYDAVLLVPSVIVLWTQPLSYRSQCLRGGAVAASLLTWVWMHLQFFTLAEGVPSLAGVGLGVWLVLELADFRSPRTGTSPAAAVEHTP